MDVNIITIKFKDGSSIYIDDVSDYAINNNVCGYCENCDAPCLENEEIIRKWLESEASNNG